jgi:hypothetical protein
LKPLYKKVEWLSKQFGSLLSIHKLIIVGKSTIYLDYININFNAHRWREKNFGFSEG